MVKKKQKHKIIHRHHHQITDWRFWRNLVIYSLAFAWIGHWFEMCVIWFTENILNIPHMHGVMNNWLEPYWVYSFAVATCILILYPIDKRIGEKFKKQPIGMRIFCDYSVNTVACALIEYLGGWILIWRFGSNINWDYTNYPFNLYGQICLQNTLLFGIVATVFTLWIYPSLNKIFSKK